MAGEILKPTALILPKCTNVAATLDHEQGALVYCTITNKLGFVTATGVSGESITSV